MKAYLRVLGNIRTHANFQPILDYARMKKLEGFISYFSLLLDKTRARIARDTGFDLEDARPLWEIQGRSLSDPLTVNILVEDLGCTANCLEVPQVYGYGETPGEAFGMLADEIVALKEELENTPELTYENFCLFLLLESVLKDEKRQV